MWYVYIIECSDKSLYTGITKDVSKRIHEHNQSDKGAKYTRSRRPVRLVYSKEAESRSEATKEEHRIKQLSRRDKIQIIQKEPPHS